MTDTASKRILYRGQVQNVGFRKRVLAISTGFKVYGIVRNLSTGEVELVAEGALGELEGFLKQISQQLGHLISASQAEDRQAQFFQDFHIEY